MKKPDQLFRWSISIFVFLMCFQLGALLFVKSLYYRAEQKLLDNKADVSFACGDFTGESSYWEIPQASQENLSNCHSDTCPDSYWSEEAAAAEQLHVVAVEKTGMTENQDGKKTNKYSVDLEVLASEKPTRLVLVSQSMMQWNLQVAEEMNQLKEVIIVAKDLVWVEGVPEDVSLTYFTPDQLCAYPSAWEEHANPENQFRRLLSALKTYTGSKAASFQGKNVAHKMQVPFAQEKRSFASAQQEVAEEVARDHEKVESGAIASQLSTGLQWLRSDQVIQAQGFQYLHGGKLKNVKVSQSVTDALYSSGTNEFFVIHNHQFGSWDPVKKSFKPLHLPLNLQAMYWPKALTFNPNKSEVYIYNEDRGGEIYAYSVVSKKWRLFAEKVGYSLLALYFNKEQSLIYGTQFKSQKIGSMVKIDQSGKAVGQIEFRKPLRFSKNRWRVQILADREDMWLKLIHPAHPGGDVYPLSQLKKL